MNDLTELRMHLFETLRALRDTTQPMETDRARAISQVAATMIDSARVEVAYLQHAGKGTQGTGFLPGSPPHPNKPGPNQPAEPGVTVRQISSGVVRTVVHTIGDN